MTGGADRWSKIRDLFERAVELPEGERSDYVARSAPDEAFAREVLELLEAAHGDDGFLERPPPGTTEPLADEGMEGRMVGPYRLLRIVGTGGMGVVWEAERADDAYRKRVAIKFVKRGMGSDMVVRRFHRERSILAGLEHPGIARLLDGGRTDDGHPWFVMEFVEGRPITTYCRTEGLSIRERLELFRHVCAAVHFAHQNLVIHRDLKPSNLLVTDDGVVKLLDFGVARLLQDAEDPVDDPTMALTRMGGRILTPAYASPEQLRGEALSTATDVYSLGIILYELVTGRRPFDGVTGSFDELAARISTDEPTRPSNAIRTGILDRPGSGVETTLGRRISEELDNIILMAIRKEPERRYPSAAELSEDLRRHLSGFPVQAQPDSRRYRVRKFIERNRTAAIAASLVVVSLGIGSVTTAWQAREARAERTLAESRFDELRELTNSLLFEVHDAIADLPGATAAREVVVRRAFQYLERMAEASPAGTGIEREVAAGYLRLGQVLGSPSGASLGDLEAARLAYERALELVSAMVARGDEGAETVATLARTRRNLGDLLAWEGKVAEAVTELRLSLAAYETLVEADHPDPEMARLEEVIAHVKLGDLLGHPVFPNLGRTDDATGAYQEARRLLSLPPIAESENWSVARFRGLVEERLGAMHREAGRLDEARAHFIRSLEARERLAAARPGHTDAVRDRGIAHQLLCGIDRMRGVHRQALAACHRAVEVFDGLRAIDPENHQTLLDLSRIHREISDVLVASDDRAGAIDALHRAIGYREELAELAPTNTRNLELLDELRERLAGI